MIESTGAMIESPAAVLAVLTGVAAFYFWLERTTGWKMFKYVVPLIWIYATPMVLRNTGVLPESSPTYDVLRQFGLPMFITLLLLSVDVGSAVRVMGKGVLVMLLGTAGIVLGAPVGYFFVHKWLAPDAWKGFGALAGSWIGGTGNMAGAAAMLDTPADQFGLAVLADTVIYVGWLPLLLVSKNFATRFNRWTGVEEDRVERMEAAAALEAEEERPPAVIHLLYLAAIAAGVTWFSRWFAPVLPEIGQPGKEIITTGTWTVLLVTTIGILLSFTPAKKLPSSHNLAMAIVYVFVARMGAVASLEGLGQAPAFLLGAAIWIAVHGLFCLAGAWLFKVDVHSAAIASAANVGGAASAPVVAAHHRESLVPVSILMALLGYAMGNYLAFVAATLCRWVGGGWMNETDPRDRNPQRIAILAGDGIGRDVTAEAIKVLEVARSRWDLPLELIRLPWDADRYLETGETLPDGALEDLRDNFSAIFIGAYGDPRVPDMKHAADILLGIRFGLDLYINFRPIKLYSDELCPLKGKTAADIDFVVFRENTEGAYVGAGGNFKTGSADEVAVQEEIHTRKGVERIIRAAFDWAVAHGKTRVCMSDKSNIMRFAGDLWQRCFDEVSADYPDIEAEHWFVDALAMQLIRKPERFEVIVTNNMFGDIITDLGAALQGGLGVAASGNLHPGRVSMFEPVHGSAPKHAGTGRANPLGAVVSVALMLEQLGHDEPARAVEAAVVASIREGRTTQDLGGPETTSRVGDYLAARLTEAPSG